MRLFVFQALIKACAIGLQDTRNITLDEHLAIFLYTCVTGLSIWHVGECFNMQMPPYLSIYCIFMAKKCLLMSFCLGHFAWSYMLSHHHLFIQPMYTSWLFMMLFHQKFCQTPNSYLSLKVQLVQWIEPTLNVVLHLRRDIFIWQEGESLLEYPCMLWPWHAVPVHDQWQDRCTADSSMYNDAWLSDLAFPEGKYYLANAGFRMCDFLLILYQGFIIIWQSGDMPQSGRLFLFSQWQSSQNAS